MTLSTGLIHELAKYGTSEIARELAGEVIRLREALESLVKTDPLKDLSDEELIIERDAGSHHAGFILNARAVLNHKETK